MAKKVSIKTVEALMKANNNIPKTVPITYILDDNEIVFNVKTGLSLFEKSNFIDRVVNCVVFDDTYKPELFDSFFNIAVLQFFTDIPVFCEDGNNINMEKTYNLCKTLHVVDKVSDAITNDAYLIGDLYDLCQSAVEFRKAQILAKNPMSDFFSNLNEFLDTIKDKFGDSLDISSIMDIFSKLPTKEDITQAVIQEAREAESEIESTETTEED